MADFFGTGGSDTITGTSGDDNITTGGGSDTINAGDGNDVVIVPPQVSPYGTLNGGNGLDTLRLDGGTFSNYIQEPGGFYNYHLSFFQTSTLTSFERFQFNSASFNRFEAQFAFGGNGTANQIGSGLSATAEIVGGAGLDRLVLLYSPGTTGGTVTAPSFTYTNWTAPTRVYQDADTVTIVAQGSGPVVMNASAHSGVQQLIGGSGNDVLNGSNDMDLLSGGPAGADLLYGNGGDDGFQLINTYVNNGLTGVTGAESTRTGAGSVFDGGSGTDFMIFGGNVNFQGTMVSIEGLYLTPHYLNTNPNGFPNLPSQYATDVIISAAAMDTLPANLILGGLGICTSIWAPAGSPSMPRAMCSKPDSDVWLYILGGTGADTVTGGSGIDYILGGAGADSAERRRGESISSTATSATKRSSPPWRTTAMTIRSSIAPGYRHAGWRRGRRCHLCRLWRHR